MSPVIVVGHRNPDNDSVVSAYAYAYLKGLIDTERDYIPARLGPMPKETIRLFDRLGIEAPIEIPHVHNRVCDAMSSPVISVTLDTTMLEAGRTIRERGIRALVVVNDEGKYAGVISSRKLAELYVAETEVTGFTDAPVKIGNLLKSIDGTIEVGDEETELTGHLLVAASEPETAVTMIAPGDAIIVGDRKRTPFLALEAGVACIVFSCGAKPTSEVVELARTKGASLLLSKHDTYATTRFASLAQSVSEYIETDCITFTPEDLLAEATEDLLASPHREAVVLDSEGFPIGILTRSDIARSVKRSVILVDHNESSQAAPGIEEATVKEIIDHHRVGDIQTSGPIMFMNLPLGSTATIVAQQYESAGVRIPEKIATLLLSAIMTDTVLLKSPTTTVIDRAMAVELGAIIGRDPIEFGMEVFRSRGGDEDLRIDDIIGRDSKEFHFGDTVMAIAQYETVDSKAILARETELVARMEEVRAAHGYDTLLLLVTDVIVEGSQFICVGKTRLVARAFDISFDEGSVWVPGILSRKKQVVGRLIECGA